jgi:hypothetical protein
VDDDLLSMSRADLLEEVRKLRAGIRTHRDSTGQDLCWHHPQLWNLLPDATDPLPTVPTWPAFMEGCIRYRQSLDRQAPEAPHSRVKFLCLAYGAEKDWLALSKPEQDELLAQDEVLRARGSLVAAVEQGVTTVRAWDGTPSLSDLPFAPLPAPLAGFGVIEAADLDEAIALVAKTPCARAGGAVELRAIVALNHDASVVK